MWPTGTFRLRLRLMNVGACVPPSLPPRALTSLTLSPPSPSPSSSSPPSSSLSRTHSPPAPEPGGFRVHASMSPVLAQTFTEPFVVFSAKRFPGVPDTTALSIALGNQGQKLPLRNRNNKQGRKRAHDESGEESD
ncbi:hypothetical protein EIP86_011379 [Pleurotus ostreatoroseus]|nr:hypothetical protein EIP86_011379 [Pleurotus ostreatoroseus]